ncbi:hypothetical protein B0O80DRAFT_452208 [Mortierella sp. GBAus27b]|nr:hypothetical protein B0O80DRAFT_452208 [Mortierella sp. GBAus27b]
MVVSSGSIALWAFSRWVFASFKAFCGERSPRVDVDKVSITVPLVWYCCSGREERDQSAGEVVRQEWSRSG